MKEYVIIFERGTDGWSAYAPDLPGLAAAGETLEEVEQLIQESIGLHIEVLRETGNIIPEPTTRVGVIPVAA